MIRRVLPFALIVAAFAFSLAVLSRLPDQIPTHWNWQGKADGYSNKLPGAFIGPVLALVFFGLLRVLPRIDPRRANYAKFAETYDLVVCVVVGAIVVLHSIALAAALGWPISISRLVPLAVAALVILLGNVLPRVRSNWWFGIRTPWTLSSDTVWAKTHRVGGYLLTGAGLVMVIAAFLPGSLPGKLTIGALVVAALGSVVYSYLAWRKEQSS